MRKLRLFLILALVPLLAVFAAAQDDSTDQAFPEELIRALQRFGWDDEAVAEIRPGLSAEQWPAFRPTDVEAVALALTYYRREAGGPVQPGDIAPLAYELADSVQLMRQVGLRPVEVGQVAVEGVRGALEARGTGGPDTPLDRGLGAAVREQILSRVADQARGRAAGRLPDNAQAMRDRAPAGGPPEGIDRPDSVEPPHGPSGPRF